MPRMVAVLAGAVVGWLMIEFAMSAWCDDDDY